MFKVNDQISVGLFFAPCYQEERPGDNDWAEFPAHLNNAINSLHLSASTHQKLPSMQLSVTDGIHFFEKLHLLKGSFANKRFGDATFVKVVIKQGDVEKLNRYFRVYSWNTASTGDQGYVYTMDCFWDADRYWLMSSVVGLEETSTDALNFIAGASGLEFYGKNTVTSDSQVWLPASQTYANFARSIATYGYAGPKSHMIFGVDSLGEMRYININAQVDPESIQDTVAIQGTTVRSGKDTYIAQEFRPKARAGIQNSLGGYVYMFVDHVFPKPKSYDAYKKVSADNLFLDDLVPAGDFPFRNTFIPTKIRGRSIVDFRPVDCGNVNTNYEKGRAQNYCYNMLNASIGEFAFSYITKWEMGDRIYLKPPAMNTTAGENEAIYEEYEGEYTIISKTILIMGTVYVEKLVGARSGVYSSSE